MLPPNSCLPRFTSSLVLSEVIQTHFLVYRQIGCCIKALVSWMISSESEISVQCFPWSVLRAEQIPRFYDWGSCSQILAHFWGSLHVKALQYNKREKRCSRFLIFSLRVFWCQAPTFGSFRNHKPQNAGTSPETTDTPSVSRHFTSEFQHLSFGKTWKTSHLMPKFGDQTWSEEGEKKEYPRLFCASTMQQPQMLSI